MKIKGDYHTHSQYSHGHGDIEKNVEKAREEGLQEIGITDHGPRAYSIVRLGIKKPETLLEIKAEINQLQSCFSDVKILTGVEANIINRSGDLDISKEILSELDIVAAGLHLLIIPPDLITAYNLIINNRITYKFIPNKRPTIRRWNTEAVINAVKKYPIDFVTHPGYQIDIDTYSLARVCAREDTCLEINCRHGKLTEDFVRAASETRVKFIINSDAHAPEEVGKLKEGLRLVKELNLDPERIVNLDM